jgi:hypothetical protein
VRFHVGGENVALLAVADGGHVIVIVLRRVVTCGTIPRLIDRAITQTSIGGARLGRTKAAYVAVFGRPSRVDRIERGFSALVYTRLGVTVFIKFGTGVAINTVGRTFRTSAGIGPCSPARALTAAYGTRLRKLVTTGPVALYRLGNLVFRVDRPHRRVGAVTLGRGTLARLIAGNSTDCGAH